jgi:hypothetical protein
MFRPCISVCLRSRYMWCNSIGIPADFDPLLGWDTSCPTVSIHPPAPIVWRLSSRHSGVGWLCNRLCGAVPAAYRDHLQSGSCICQRCLLYCSYAAQNSFRKRFKSGSRTPVGRAPYCVPEDTGISSPWSVIPPPNVGYSLRQSRSSTHLFCSRRGCWVVGHAMRD